MQPNYYVLWYHLDRKDRFLIWYTFNQQNANYDGDSVWLDDTGHAPVFISQRSVRAQAVWLGLDIMSEEPILYNLDRIKHLLDMRHTTARRKQNMSVDCIAVLAAWNFFSDVQYSLRPTQNNRIPRRQKSLYHKIFVGNDLPALTPPGKHYTPLWNKKELRQLRSILHEGLRLFRKTARLTRVETNSC